MHFTSPPDGGAPEATPPPASRSRWSPARLWPASLSGQLITLLVLAILVAQGISIWIFHDERRLALAEVARDNILSRSVAMARLVEDMPKDFQARVLEAGRSRFSNFWIADAPAADPREPSKTERRVVAWLQGEFDEARDIRLDINRKREDMSAEERSFKDQQVQSWRERQMREHSDDEHERKTSLEKALSGKGDVAKDLDEDFRPRKWHKDVALSIRLKDGRWFNMTTDYRPPDRSIIPFLVQLLLTIVATSVIVAFLMRRLSRPLRDLAGAAERLGRGETVEALPESGPGEVQALTRAFNDMQDRLTRFVQDRTRMLAAISHDLRTPITSLRLRAEFIDDDENREKMIATLDEMSQMTEATLAFARDEATREEAQKLDLGSLLQSLADDQQDMGHDVKAEDHGRLVVRCRPLALKRALRNLIENGVRYGASVCLSYAQDAGNAVIHVRDKGPGIPEDRLRDVFEPFVRLEESRSEETGGIGLGLSITRSIIHAHGGTVTLANHPDGGLDVEVRLPLGG
ncbi:ATP-binding protein [Roseibium aestuarii]|uniref:histidine kinase n=1 Tax=Roseibium aestuarii TaxID=2600299 RepID=A0ABW4JU15_9HYPH|nr:ATP-binding protein [Roseibium aestuarii]